MTDLPAGWERVRLADVALLGSGGTPRAGDPRYYGGEIPWAVIRDLNDGPVSRTAATITSEGLAASSAKMVPAGALLIAMYGSIGKLGITGVPMSTNQAISFIKPIPGRLDVKFLFHFMYQSRPGLIRLGKGVAQKNIGQGLLRDWQIPLPSIGEQQRLAEFLDDNLSHLNVGSTGVSTAKRRAGTWRRAQMDEGFIEASSGFDSLSKLVERVEAGRSFGGSSRPAGPGEWGVIRVSAMTWGEFRPEENKRVPDELANPRYLIEAGDVLVSRANTTAYVGAPVFVHDTPPNLLLSDKSLRLVPNPGVDPRWLVAALSMRHVRRQVSALATGTKDSMRNISQSNLLSVSVPVASAEQQTAALLRCDALMFEAERLSASIGAVECRGMALRRSLLDAAFSGRL